MDEKTFESFEKYLKAKDSKAARLDVGDLDGVQLTALLNNLSIAKEQDKIKENLNFLMSLDLMTDMAAIRHTIDELVIAYRNGGIEEDQLNTAVKQLALLDGNVLKSTFGEDYQNLLQETKKRFNV